MTRNVAPVVASDARQRSQHLLRQEVERGRGYTVGIVGAGTDSRRLGRVRFGMVELEVCNDRDRFLRGRAPDDAQARKVERQESEPALKIVRIVSVVDRFFAFAVRLGILARLLSACHTCTHHQRKLVLLKLDQQDWRGVVPAHLFHLFMS